MSSPYFYDCELSSTSFSLCAFAFASAFASAFAFGPALASGPASGSSPKTQPHTS
jgi:hypothetical protein